MGFSPVDSVRSAAVAGRARKGRESSSWALTACEQIPLGQVPRSSVTACEPGEFRGS